MNKITVDNFVKEFNLDDDKFEPAIVKDILSYLHIKTPKAIIYDGDSIIFITFWNEVFAYHNLSTELINDVRDLEKFILGTPQVERNGIFSYDIEYFEKMFKIHKNILLDKSVVNKSGE